MKNYMKKCVLLCAALLTLAVFAGSSFAWSASEEVRRLNKEVPSLEGFKGAQAVIWLKDNDFRMLADGTMENTRYTIVMMGENVPDSWKKFKVPVPSDGKLEVIEAAWYNPMTGFKEGSLRVSEETLPGGSTGKIFETPGGAVGRAVVLAVKETRGKRYGIDAMIPMASPLPTWEQNVTVTLPEGVALNWAGHDIKEPVIGKSKGSQNYKWTIMNQEAWNGEGFVVYRRPYLTFGTKKGVAVSLKDMYDLARDVPALPLPSAAKGDKAKAGVRLMEWLAQPSHTLEAYPKDWIRPAAQFPAEGPWTQWEQTLLLDKWLKKLGWTSEVMWQAVGKLDKDSPVTYGAWTAPVLALTPPGGKESLYHAGQTSDFGVTAPSVIGTTLYSLKNDETISRNIKPGSPSDHKLTSIWALKLGDNGVAEGTFTLTVTGGWTELFSAGHVPSKEGLAKFVQSKVNFAIPGMTLTPTEVEPTPTGYRLQFSVKCAPGLVMKDNLLLRLPGGVP
ncbi:MAG: hypothetical protein Q4F74_02735, partial [Synergistaceae bacterium]|nr:hypothetical protein [Synergistaceae bacterium]